jgi:hypothetical protein
MPIPSHRNDPDLDNLLRAALTKPQRHTVWAMLHDKIGADSVSRNAEPIRVQVEIDGDEGQLVWHPVSGVTLGGAEVPPVEVLRTDRVWWCSWARRFAQARLRVELEGRQEPAQSAADQALAGLDAWEKALARTTARALGVLSERERYGLDGDKKVRVIAEFPAPRGYREA